MSSSKRGLGDLAVEAACALAETLFVERSPDGGAPEIQLAQAHMIVSGRLDLWTGWYGLDPEAKALVGRLLHVRHNELASRQRFLDAARRLFDSHETAYAIPVGVPAHTATHVRPAHGQPPVELAKRLIAAMEAEDVRRRPPLPMARGGSWEFGWQDRTTVVIPDGFSPPDVEPLNIVTAEALPEVGLVSKELVDIAAELDEVHGGTPWRAEILSGLLSGLRDRGDLQVDELVASAGALSLLNAPTGVGKTVLMQVVALALCRAGIPVALVASNIDDALSIRDALALDIEKLTWNRPLPACSLLISPRRLREKALAAAAIERWERADQLGYGCALTALVKDGPLPVAGEEPCTGLRPVDPSGHDKRRVRGDSSNGRHSCPLRGVCDRHRPAREAATAEIIVTYHHYLASGQIPVPVRVDGVDLDRMSVMELVMRRCPVVLVDEVDQFQSALVETGSQEVTLAAKGGGTNGLPLAQLEVDRARLTAGADRRVVPPLSRTRYLSEQFLNYVLDGELWLDDETDRLGSGWHIPGGEDRLLLDLLLGVPEGVEIPDSAFPQLNALFPDREDPAPASLPEDLEVVRQQIALSVSNDDGADRIREVKHNLQVALAERVPDQARRTRVVNALLVRAWLGALRQALTRLTYAVTTPDVQLPAARQLSETLGMFVRHAAIPYGALGYMLFGFRVSKTTDVPRQGRLFTQAIAGDPHTTTVQLGGTVALTTAGTERIVVGLSATAFFPGAAREHIQAPLTWAMTDAHSGGVTAAEGTVLGDGYQPIRVGGLPEGSKDPAIIELGHRLWDQHLESHFAALRLDAGRADRARVLIVGNSYRQVALLAQGLSQVVDPRRLAVAVSASSEGQLLLPPQGAVPLRPGQFETFPHLAGADILLAPIARVARGLNILVPGQQRSALSSIWVCVRPVAQLLDAPEMFASINAHGVAAAGPTDDPSTALELQRKAAHRRMYKLLGTDPRFSLMPRGLKAEAIAGMLVDFIQLAGRARRGGTEVELYFVDNAFHDTQLASDLPSLLRFHHDSLSADEQLAMRRVYGHTLTSLLAYAGVHATEGSK